MQIREKLRVWQVFVRYGERHYQLGARLLYAAAHCAWSACAIEQALGNPEKRAKREVADGLL